MMGVGGEFALRLLFTKYSKFCLNMFWEIVGLRGRWLVSLKSLSTIKKGTSPFDFQSIEPFSYDNTFYINLIFPGGCHPQRPIIRPLNYVEQNPYLKILIGFMWGNGGRERGLVALQSLSTIKKGTSPFNFKSNESFLKF
jgi:hypothetical protein